MKLFKRKPLYVWSVIVVDGERVKFIKIFHDSSKQKAEEEYVEQRIYGSRFVYFASHEVLR
jgi:hypothetical protein